MRTVVWPSLSETQQESVLERPAISAGANITATVQDLISQVRREGDKALLALTEKFDRVKPDTLRVSQA
ncbi:TPA: histidinol dehydrogenase, partial [Vibrio metschnikovii]